SYMKATFAEDVERERQRMAEIAEVKAPPDFGPISEEVAISALVPPLASTPHPPPANAPPQVAPVQQPMRRTNPGAATMPVISAGQNVIQGAPYVPPAN